MTDRSQETLLKEYGEVSNNFRALAEIRFKLLAFLPLASGLAVGLGVIGKSPGYALSIGTFFLVVTLGLMTYNSRNDQLYDSLVGRAAAIERELGLNDGAFANRPRPWLTLFAGKWRVDHRSAIASIYFASSSLWAFVMIDSLARLVPEPGDTGDTLAIVSAATAVLLTAATFYFARRARSRAEQALRWDAFQSVRQFESIAKSGVLPSYEALPSDLRRRWSRLGGVADGQLAARFRYLRHNSAHDQSTGLWYSAQFVADLTDLAPQWLFDCATERRRQILEPVTEPDLFTRALRSVALQTSVKRRSR